MQVLEVLEHIPEIAEAMERAQQVDRDCAIQAEPSSACPWTLQAREPGQPGCGTLRLRSYSQGRTLAVELSQLGFVVAVRDREDRVRLRMWPPSSH
ncbi:MAG TPA: hypothetical protein VFE82_04410 [Ramlibacter sp.]|jgi:hypothetical protein|uniref:hypothetical protein n=1 Tax=Ramlibacter sp. TaxID=1917967 RepID=UPI002D424C68|nr:hypothetical protein [Ramlibacter sp.]HZY17698.1 hypothetical protein [Ramlibacter sp.]